MILEVIHHMEKLGYVIYEEHGIYSIPRSKPYEKDIAEMLKLRWEREFENGLVPDFDIIEEHHQYLGKLK